MTAAAKIIEQQIRDLPLEDMLTIHAQLVTSIHAKEDSDFTAFFGVSSSS